MPSPFSLSPADLCQHAEYHACCPACRASDIRFAQKGAVKQKEKREKSAADIRKLLGGELSAHDRRKDKLRFEKQLKQIETQLSQWEELSQGLRALLGDLEKQIQAYCERYEPEDLRAALVSDAEELEDEMLREWQESASTMEGEEAGFLQFMPLDPGRDRTFKGLDHATVPATPDMLITEGRGLQIFTKASKGTNKTIVGALGKDTGGAVMSFGRAVEMLGLPEGPGKDYDRESASTTEPGTDMSNVESLGPVLSSASLDDPPAVANDKATTESEWRERHPHSPPVLSQQQQLDIIGLKQLYLWSGNLANMYYKLATEQEKHEEEEELRLQAERDRLAAENEGADGENFAAPAVEEVMAVQPIEAVPSSKPASYPIGWPLVEKKDFAGYTNWLHALQKEDPKVHKTSLAPWIEQRNKRHGEIQTAIDSWKEPVTAQSQQLDTTRFYNGPPLLKVDMERAGIKTESVGLSGKGGKRT